MLSQAYYSAGSPLCQLGLLFFSQFLSWIQEQMQPVSAHLRL